MPDFEDFWSINDLYRRGNGWKADGFAVQSVYYYTAIIHDELYLISLIRLPD